MDLLQCVLSADGEKNPAVATRQNSRHNNYYYYHSNNSNSNSRMRNPREQDYPAGYYTAPAGGGARRLGSSNTFGGFRSSGKQQQQQQQMRHWGSSLSIDGGGSSDASVHELRSRTLRPAMPSDRATPARDSIAHTSQPRTWLPATGLQTRARRPELKEFLEKPRLVSTLGCVERKPSQQQQQQHQPVPVARNLRLAGFLDDPSYGSDGELIPDVLRQYYLDTYLDTYEFEYLKNFGDLDLDKDEKEPETGSMLRR